MTNRLLIFTATFNEADNVEALVEEIWDTVPNAEILVVDDNSTDGTGGILETLKAESKGKLHVIHRPRKLGLGTAHKLAFKFAAANNYDALITMDADFSHHPRYIPTIVKLLSEGSEFVIGSRYVDGGSCDYTGIRLLISRTANILARNLLGIKLNEATTSFRGFSKELLSKLEIDTVKSNGYSFFIESVYRVGRATNSVVEFPIHFEDRRFGTTKISKSEVRKGVFTLVRLAVQRLRAEKSNSNPIEGATAKGIHLVCNNCRCPYDVEVYPASVEQHESVQYNCTSFHHSSHGRVVRCLGCNLVYTNPQLPQEEIEKLYSDVQDDTYLENIEARYSTFRYNLDKLKPYLKPGAKLLDLGAYCGAFLKIAKEEGFDVSGVEPSRWASSYARESVGVAVTTGTLKELPVDDLYEVITSWDVLEHFSDPVAEIKEVREKLIPGGIFAFSTLNTSNWFPRLLGERWPWYMDMHLYYFSEQVLKDMLERNGFELINVRSYCHIITADYFVEKLESLGIPFMGFIKRSKLAPFLRRFQIPFRFGDIQMFVCKKVPLQEEQQALAFKQAANW